MAMMTIIATAPIKDLKASFATLAILILAGTVMMIGSLVK
jgi:hypothetical protein